ncbi:MAG: hypothetical protein ACTSQF_13580 [Candidatus Heimdallarchaeaceae archaeon]
MTSWAIILCAMVTLSGVYQITILRYQDLTNPLSEPIVNTESEQSKDYFFTPETDTHYDNYSIITNWEIEQYHSVNDLVVIDNVTFLATSNGLCIYNTSKLANPTLISQSFLGREISKIQIENDLVYFIYNYGNYFFIANISDLSNPVEVNQILFNDIRDFVVENNTVFICAASEFYGLLIYNFSDPYNPYIIGEYEFFDFTYLHNLQKQEDSLFCLTNRESFLIIDVADLKTPNLLVVQNLNSDCIDLFVKGDYLYLLDDHFIDIWDISNLQSPILCDSVRIQNGAGLFVYNNYVFILNSSSTTEFLIFDVTNPNNIILVSLHADLFSPYIYNSIIYVEEEIAYLANSYDGFVILNISDHQNITKICHDFSGTIMGLHIIDDCAYVEYQYRGFKILNISDILNPIVLARVYFFGFYKHMFIDNNLTYLCTSSRLFIYNLSDFSNPVKISEYSLGTIRKITVRNGFVFVSSYTDIRILNVSDPYNPTEVYRIPCLSTLRDFTIYNELLFATFSSYPDHYFQIINISNPLSPTLVTQVSIAFTPWLVRTNGSYLFFAMSSSTYFFIYDIQNVTNPFQVSQIETKIDITEFSVRNDSLYFFNRNNGLEIRGLTAQYNLTLTGKLSPYQSYYSQYNAGSHGIRDDIIFMANSYDLLVIGLDSDNDSIANYMEINVYGTNPFDVDSDHDLMLDDYEIAYNLNPLDDTDASLDFDGDTLLNYDESLINTDPWSNDTDSDLLTDDLEVFYGTNPLNPDTDLDLLSDFEEIYVYSTDPLTGDTDGDLLADGFEVLNYFTDPLDNDTDDDSMDDWFEVTYRLDPFSDDSALDLDLDGLTNLEEYLLGTFPNRSDSDGDDYSDLEEIENGTDPLDPLSHPDYSLHPTSTTPVTCFGCSVIAFLVLSLTAVKIKTKNKPRRKQR